jgi:type I restriction enzyme S subunit
MGIGWPKYTLGDLCSFKYGHMPRKTDLCDDGYPVFSGYRIVGYATTYHYEEPEIIVVARGVGGTGDVKMSPPKCFLTNLSIVAKVVSAEVDKKFLYYRLAGPKLWELRTGSAQAQITIDRLQRYELRLPPLPTQQKIAAILSAYDDLIENNLRRIKILEEMAKNLYREWFVKFRFPDHQNARFIDSPLDSIPEGWEVIKVGDILKKVKRGTKIQKQDYATEGLIPVVDQGKEFIGGYTDDTESLISYDLPLIVFGDHTRVLKFIDFPFACGADGTQLLKSDNERMPMSLFYYALLSIDLSDFAYARHFKFLKEEALVLPAKSVVDLFDQFVSPLRDQTRSLMRKNTTLRRTRDLLLPRLISGEVDVSELDITIPEEAIC